MVASLAGSASRLLACVVCLGPGVLSGYLPMLSSA